MLINSADIDNSVLRDFDYESMASDAVAQLHFQARRQLELDLGAAAAAGAPAGVMDRLVETMELGLKRSEGAFFISDPRLPDFPIVYVSEAFLRLTGYTRDDVVGKNCRFLKNPGSDMDDVCILANAYAHCTKCDVLALDCKKNCDAFWNFIHLEPTHSLAGMATLFIHAQSDLTEYVETVAVFGGEFAAKHQRSDSVDVGVPSSPSMPLSSSCDEGSDNDDLSLNAFETGVTAFNPAVPPFNPLRNIVDEAVESFPGGVMEFVDDCLVQIPQPDNELWFHAPPPTTDNEWAMPIPNAEVF
jgi:PAS domain S-box-containing protein